MDMKNIGNTAPLLKKSRFNQNKTALNKLNSHRDCLVRLSEPTSVGLVEKI